MIAQNIDIRRGKPSASASERLFNCPGSHKRSAGIPRKSNPHADSGSRVHAWLEHQDVTRVDGMTDDEIEIAEKCYNQAVRIEDEFFGPRSLQELYIELRLGMTAMGVVRAVSQSDSFNYAFTGQADRIVIHGDRALIVDFKSGRGQYAHAANNAQLRSLAALVHQWNQSINAIRVAIVQPYAGGPTIADYDHQALNEAELWLDMLVANVDDADPLTDLSAGPWCQYCPALEGCPKAQATALAPVEALAAEPLPAAAAKEAIMARAFELPADKLAEALRGLQLVGWYGEAIKYAATRRIADGEQIDGWELVTTKPKRTVTDAGKIYTRLAPLGVSAEQFAAICSITMTALKPVVKAATGTKGKALDEAVAGVLEGACTEGKPSTKLVRVGEAIEEGAE